MLHGRPPWIARAPSLSLLALCLAACAQAAASEPGLAIGAESYALENGLQVILQPDHRFPVVVVHVRYHVGSGDERPGISGLAGDPRVIREQVGPLGLGPVRVVEGD
jgi:hypothetical protein